MSFDTDITEDMNNSLNNENRYNAMKDAVMEVVGGHFRPEFINRIDEVVVFHGLSAENIQGIAKIQLQRLAQRLVEQDMTLNVSDAAVAAIAKEGFDPAYGARPLKRVIQRELQNPLAVMVLEGKIQDSQTVHVKTDKKGLLIEG